MHTLMKNRGTNQLDDLTPGLVNAMKYSNSDGLYPEYTEEKPDEGADPEWFYAVYRRLMDVRNPMRSTHISHRKRCLKILANSCRELLL